MSSKVPEYFEQFELHPELWVEAGDGAMGSRAVLNWERSSLLGVGRAARPAEAHDPVQDRVGVPGAERRLPGGRVRDRHAPDEDVGWRSGPPADLLRRHDVTR